MVGMIRYYEVLGAALNDPATPPVVDCAVRLGSDVHNIMYSRMVGHDRMTLTALAKFLHPKQQEQHYNLTSSPGTFVGLLKPT